MTACAGGSNASSVGQSLGNAVPVPRLSATPAASTINLPSGQTQVGATQPPSSQSTLPLPIMAGPTPATAASVAGSSSVRVTVRYSGDAPATTGAMVHTNETTRHLQYISTANANITIAVTPIGGGTTTFGPTACVPGTCTISFTAVPGPTALTFTLTSAGGNILSTFKTVQIVQPSIENTLNFSANPVVDSVALTLFAVSHAAGAAYDDVPSVNAYDKNNAIIVGSAGYVDASGNPLTLTLNVANVQAGGSGTVVITGPSRITAPVQAAIYAHYDGKWLDHSVISVSPSSAIGGTVTGATFTTTPTVVAYGGFTANSEPYNVATGPDGNLWITEFNGNNILRMSPSGSVLNEYPTLGGPHYIVSGPDGKLWFTEYGVGEIGRLTLSGSLTNFIPASGAALINIQ